MLFSSDKIKKENKEQTVQCLQQLPQKQPSGP